MKPDILIAQKFLDNVKPLTMKQVYINLYPNYLTAQQDTQPNVLQNTNSSNQKNEQNQELSFRGIANNFEKKITLSRLLSQNAISSYRNHTSYNVRLYRT